MQPLRGSQIAPLALAQLESWRAYAAKWYWRLERRQTEPDHRIPNVEQYHIVCVMCEHSITVLSTDGLGYLLNAERILDEVTRHLRNIHRGIEAEVYGDKQDSTAGPDSRGFGIGNGSDPDPGGLQAEK